MSTAAFESFWQAYPRKEGKAAVLKKWEQKKLDDMATVIVAHLQQRVRDDKKWKDGFIPQPLTFINQERWTDEYEKIVSRQPLAAKPGVKVEEVWPQPCQWRAAANRVLFAVLQAANPPSSRLQMLIVMKNQMGDRLRNLYGDGPCPAEDWRKISKQSFEWLLKAANGSPRKTRGGESAESEGEPSELAA